MSKLPDIPLGKIVHAPDSSMSQEDIFSAYKSPMMKDKIDEETELDDLIEEAPNSAEIDRQVQDFLLPSESVTDKSIHARPKYGKHEGKDVLRRSLQEKGYHPDESLLDCLTKSTKDAILSSGEMEVMFLTIRACQEDFELKMIRNALSDILSKIKEVVSEVDDLNKRSKEAKKVVDENSYLINMQSRALNEQKIIPTQTTPIVKAMTSQEIACAMLKGTVKQDVPNYRELEAAFARYIEFEKPQMSVDTFVNLPLDQRGKLLKHVVVNYMNKQIS